MLNRIFNLLHSHRQPSMQKMAHSSSVFSAIVGILMVYISVCDVILAGPPEAVEKFQNNASNHRRDIYFEHAYIHRKFSGTERANHIFQLTDDSALAFAWITMTEQNGSKAAQGTQYDLWAKMSKYDSEIEWAFIGK